MSNFAITMEPLEIAWNFYGSKAWTIARMSWKTAALRCTAPRGWSGGAVHLLCSSFSSHVYTRTWDTSAIFEFTRAFEHYLAFGKFHDYISNSSRVIVLTNWRTHTHTPHHTPHTSTNRHWWKQYNICYAVLVRVATSKMRHTLEFLSRDIANMFVCLSVRNVPVFYGNGLTCIIVSSPHGSPITPVLRVSNIFAKFRRGHLLRGR